MNTALKYHLIEPTESDVELSKKVGEALAKGDVKKIEKLIHESMQSGNIKEALSAIFETLSAGQKLSISSSENILTSQEAADLLNVSRPYLNKLLDTGIIPSYKDGKHRRVHFKDLMKFKMKREYAEKDLQELTDEAQKLKLGW